MAKNLGTTAECACVCACVCVALVASTRRSSIGSSAYTTYLHCITTLKLRLVLRLWNNAMFEIKIKTANFNPVI